MYLTFYANRFIHQIFVEYDAIQRMLWYSRFNYGTFCIQLHFVVFFFLNQTFPFFYCFFSATEVHLLHPCNPFPLIVRGWYTSYIMAIHVTWWHTCYMMAYMLHDGIHVTQSIFRIFKNQLLWRWSTLAIIKEAAKKIRGMRYGLKILLVFFLTAIYVSIITESSQLEGNILIIHLTWTINNCH